MAAPLSRGRVLLATNRNQISLGQPPLRWALLWPGAGLATVRQELAHSLRVESQPRFGPVSEAHRPQSLRVLVDPRPRDAESRGNFGRGQRCGGVLERLRPKDLHYVARDRVDARPVEPHRRRQLVTRILVEDIAGHSTPKPAELTLRASRFP